MSGAYPSHGGRQQRKRPRDDQHDDFRRPRRADLLYSLQRDLTNLADPGGNVSPLEDIKYVGRKLAGEFEHQENKTPILEMLRDAVVQLSIKTCQYSAAVTLAGLANKQFGQSIVESAAEWVKDALMRQDWLPLKLLLRFVAGLDQILQDYGVFEYLKAFSTQLESADARSDYADALCKVVLLTIPYLAAGTSHANTHRLTDLTKLLDHLEIYMHKRAEQASGKLTLHYNESNAPYEQKEELVSLFEQSKKAASAGWNIRVLARFQEHYIESERFSLSPLVLEPALPSGVEYPVKYVLRLFVGQAAATTPTEDDLSGALLRDMTVDLLETCVVNRKDAARFLIDMEAYLPGGLFVLRGTPLDKLAANGHGTTWKAEDIVVEAIFAELLALPVPKQKAIYYHAVLTELCKLVPQAVAPTFGRAIRQLYNTSPAMEPELVVRTWDWLSHHLSNFNFNWKWQEWQGDLTLPVLLPKQVLIRETILKEVELSYHQRIRSTLPEAYHALIQDEAPGPRFTFVEGHALYDQATELSTLLQQAQQPEALEKIDSLFQTISENAPDAKEATIIRVLVECALQLGHQSFSHALNTIEQTLPLLKQRCSVSREKQRLTVASVMRFWRERPAVGLALLSKMVNYGIVEGSALVDWLLNVAQYGPSTEQDTEGWEKSVLGSRSVLAQSVAWELLLQLVFAKQATQTGQLKTRGDVLRAATAKQRSIVDAAEKVSAPAETEEKAETPAKDNGDTDLPMKTEDDSRTIALDKANALIAEHAAELTKVEQRIETIAKEKLEVVAQLCKGLTAVAKQDDALLSYWARGLLRTVARRQSEILWQNPEAAEEAAEVEPALREVRPL